jgi:hypothetical protein
MTTGRKSESLKALLQRARETWKTDDPSSFPSAPPGFADRVVSMAFMKPSEPLLLWMRMGYGGLAAALVLALAVAVFPPKPQEANAADLWMNLEL